MSKFKTLRLAAIAAVIAGPLTAAMATNGYFSHGYGMKAKGMGGAAVASEGSGFAAANNPASSAWAGNHVEIGLDLFSPERDITRDKGTYPGGVTSDSTLFYVPEFDYNRAISNQMSVGISVYGNGGMNTDYGGKNFNCGGGASNALCGSTRLGVDLSQLIIAPTLGWKVNDTSSLGVSLLYTQQQFKADGLQAFTGAGSTQNPAAVTNNGYDSSSGWGVRLGYLAKLNDKLNLGVSYSPKTSMSKFGKYAGLFANDGGFDIPENMAVGIAFAAAPNWNVSVDYERINYSGVPAIANPSNAILSGIKLGAANGSGFGWKDIDVWKLGVEWKAMSQLTMRAGVNIGGNPIKSADATFNILAPGVTTTHYTLGGTYAMSNKSDVTFAYMYAPSNSVSGETLPAIQNQGAASMDTIKMNQQSLGVQFGWKF